MDSPSSRDRATEDDARRRKSSLGAASSLEHTQTRWKRALNGCEIRFPLTPYDSQIRVMSTVVRAAQTRSCALIESPTGSGKSLALLCAALAWCERESERRGGVEARGETTAVEGEEAGEDDDGENGRRSRGERQDKGKSSPKVFYATRTHSQIAQVVSELARTSYKPRTVVLASREHYCVNKSARKSGSVNEECRRLMDMSAGGDGRGCFYAGQAASKLASLAKSHQDALDIEDLVKLGTSKKGCPYFASKIMAESAELIFCPYSYILDPRTRAAMDIDIKDSLIIFDEAHNIEDTAREAASEETWLDEIAHAVERLIEMKRLATVNVEESELVLQTMKGVYEWFLHFCDEQSEGYGLHPTPQAFETWSATIRGEQSLQAFAHIGLTQETMPNVMRALEIVTKHNQEKKDLTDRVPGGVFATCEKVLNPIRFLLSKGELTARDYRIVFTKTIDGERMAPTQRNSGMKRLPIDEVVKINFWALNPALAFRDLVGENGARSVVLTSGTLAPLSSFASELGVDFPIRLEAQHCIDMGRQVWGAVVSSGPNRIALNAGYKSRSDYGFQDELGTSLQKWAQVTPHGMLMFFPSYSLMDNIVRRWRETGAWQAIEQASGKKMFQEPGKSTQYTKKPLTLEQVLEKYYAAVASSVKAAKHPYAAAPENAKSRGGILLAVCRGKISEGIDFADANARAVIAVGIPYPNIKDSLVAEKRSYNDEGRHRGLLSGSQWYDQQAYRALNQAVGRCLRHRHDHGAIILVDERFKQQSIMSLPKWLRPAMQRTYESFDDQLTSLEAFFASHAETPPGEHEPAFHSKDKTRKRTRVSLGTATNSPRKAMRNAPITNFFKATSGEENGEDHLMREITSNIPSPAKTNENVYVAPTLMDDDDEDMDFDVDALVRTKAECAKVKSPETIKELSPEAACAQILDGIEWDDEDDENEWFEQALQATQTGQTMSKLESTTPTVEQAHQEITSPLKSKPPCGDVLCSVCGNTHISLDDADRIECVTLKSRYLDQVFGGKVEHRFVRDAGAGRCVGVASPQVDFDEDLRIAFRTLTSCDGAKVIGFRVEAANVEHTRLLNSSLLAVGA